eukprot:TRINITY_DN7294_c0_g1_i1.p1 TRINITY_DN7294_c0_g1~~TRINITY_DN7294_c0_g1_i1.p1  ORF type:complete len:145 (-),score=31.57 TRINITY_DN7294_c0_g1_i1:62-496(-)
MVDDVKLKEETKAWFDAFFDLTDVKGDFSSWIDTFHTPDSEVVFGNLPKAKGKAEIIKTIGSFGRYVATLKHELLRFDIVEDRIWGELKIHYTIKNDPNNQLFVFPAAAIYHKKPHETKIHRLDVFADLSPLFAKIKELHPEFK